MNKKMHIATVALFAAAVSFAQEVTPESEAPIAFATESAEVAQGEISSDAAAEMNKDVTTHVKTTARSKVKDDIKAYCKERGITIGEVTPKDAIYIEGVERVAANVSFHCNFWK